MNISKINLNLLIALDALLTERNVTNAGKKIFITQSAMSNVLKQLRDLFQDELLILTGRTMQLTLRAQQLHPEIKKFILQTEAIFNLKKFDPSTCHRKFILGMEEYTNFFLLPDLYTYLNQHAPNIELQIKNIPLFKEKSMLESQEIELAIGFFQLDSESQNNCHDFLFKERMVCAVSPSHPLFNKRLTLKRYLEAKHISIVTDQKTPVSIVDQVLNEMGYKRHIVLKLSHIVPALYTIAKNDLIATVPEGIAREASRLLNLLIKPCPFDIPQVSFLQVWHPWANNDAGSYWFRNVVKNIARNIQK